MATAYVDVVTFR